MMCAWAGCEKRREEKRRQAGVWGDSEVGSRYNSPCVACAYRYSCINPYMHTYVVCTYINMYDIRQSRAESLEESRVYLLYSIYCIYSRSGLPKTTIQ